MLDNVKCIFVGVFDWCVLCPDGGMSVQRASNENLPEMECVFIIVGYIN